MQIKEFAEKVHALAKEKGWWEDYTGSPEQIASRLALVHSEVSEALEDVRVQDGFDSLAEVRYTAKGKPYGFPIELADIIIRVFDLAGGTDVDIVAAMLAKHAYNQHRAYRHGGKKL